MKKFFLAILLLVLILAVSYFKAVRDRDKSSDSFESGRKSSEMKALALAGDIDSLKHYIGQQNVTLAESLTIQQKAYLKELDSLADTISFGVAPAIFGFTLIQTPLAIVSFTIFLFCGVLRLARYNIMDMKDSYAGMPITLNGIIIPLIFITNVPFDYYPYIYILLGILMISSLKFKKI